MNLKDYFDGASGLGVLATADAQGKVNAAVYARPHVMSDGTIAFIMAERLTYENLKSNPSAAFLFKADGEGYRGVRLYLTKLREEQDSELMHELRRRACEEDMQGRFLVYFRVDKALALIGAEELEVALSA